MRSEKLICRKKNDDEDISFSIGNDNNDIKQKVSVPVY
jgi:hypothetical protein